MKKILGGIVIGPICSLNCVFCGGHPKTNEAIIKEQEIKVYKNLQYLKAEGIRQISISGSDPIEYARLPELVQYIKSEGFEHVQLSTHGAKLENYDLAKKLIETGVNKFRIPLYGSNAKIHDSLTRTPSSFDQVTQGIKNLLSIKPDIKIQISCLIMEQNKNDLTNIVNLISSFGIKDFYFSVPCLTSEDDSFYVPFKDVQPYVKKLYKHAIKINGQAQFLEIPFCIFGIFNQKNINNTCAPPNMGKYNQPLGQHKTNIPDMPAYRLKKKVDMCNKCIAFNFCDGFFVNDIDRFGVGKIKPIVEIVE